jgi:hypothetical protein
VGGVCGAGGERRGGGHNKHQPLRQGMKTVGVVGLQKCGALDTLNSGLTHQCFRLNLKLLCLVEEQSWLLRSKVGPATYTAGKDVRSHAGDRTGVSGCANKTGHVRAPPHTHTTVPVGQHQ